MRGLALDEARIVIYLAIHAAQYVSDLDAILSVMLYLGADNAALMDALHKKRLDLLASA